MRNIIYINAATGFYKIEKEAGENCMIVQFDAVTGENITIELYKGNQYYKNLACRVLGGSAAATFPQNIFTGNNLHFRIVQDGTPGPFFHLVFDTNKNFDFNPLNFVVFSNTKRAKTGQFIAGTNRNTYDSLHPFTQDQLEAFNYKTLKGGQL